MSGRSPAFGWRRLHAWLTAFAVVLVGARAWAYPVPPLSGPVVDEAGVLDAGARDRLADKLRRYQAEAGPQIQVYVARSLRGEPIEDVAYQVARGWKLGDAARDDGVLLLIATAERKIRIETGKGVGDRITDIQSSAIIREQIGPALKRNDYAAGINAGVDQLAHLLGAPSAPVRPTAAVQNGERGGAGVLAPIVVGVLLMIVFLVFFSGRGGRGGGGRGGGGGGGGEAFLAGMWLGSSGGGWSSGGSSWGDSGGGGWSGGGGDFGGGGASGDY